MCDVNAFTIRRPVGENPKPTWYARSTGCNVVMNVVIMMAVEEVDRQFSYMFTIMAAEEIDEQFPRSTEYHDGRRKNKNR